MAALLVLAVVGVAVIAAPWLAPADPMAVRLEAALLPSDIGRWAGTDMFGRDVWSRTLYGGRLTLGMAALASLVALVPGVALGMVAGYTGGMLDAVISRAVDAVLAIPYLLWAMVILAVVGSGPGSVGLAVGLAGMPIVIRVIRSSVISVRSREFVQTARAVGCTECRILLRHVVPNIGGTIIVMATLQMGWAMLNVSALNFLGLGVPPGVPEWGALLNEGRAYIRQAPWIAAAPGVALTATIMSLNLLGDHLRDALDPYSWI
ncbi:MAG: ABC transporter permease [Anaerolineae bacterium]